MGLNDRGQEKIIPWIIFVFVRFARGKNMGLGNVLRRWSFACPCHGTVCLLCLSEYVFTREWTRKKRFSKTFFFCPCRTRCSFAPPFAIAPMCLPRALCCRAVLSVWQTAAFNTQKGPALSGQARWSMGIFLLSVPHIASSARSRYDAMLAVHLFASTICPWAKMVFLANW